jgi:hypothetical protein
VVLPARAGTRSAQGQKLLKNVALIVDIQQGNPPAWSSWLQQRAIRSPDLTEPPLACDFDKYQIAISDNLYKRFTSQEFSHAVSARTCSIQRVSNGLRPRGYEFVAPLDSKGRIDRHLWQKYREHCGVRSFGAAPTKKWGDSCTSRAGRSTRDACSATIRTQPTTTRPDIASACTPSYLASMFQSVVMRVSPHLQGRVRRTGQVIEREYGISLGESSAMPRHIWRSGGDLRRRLYEILEHGAIGDRTGLIVGRLIVVLIVTNLVTMALDSVPALQAQYGPLFIAIELLSLVVFTVEYGLRVWVAAEHAPHRHSSERKARWEFCFEPARRDRSSRGPAVLVRICLAGRSAGPAGVSDGALSQVGALLTRHALAARCSLRRAPCFVRLLRHFTGRDAARRKRHARGRRPRAAR